LDNSLHTNTIRTFTSYAAVLELLEKTKARIRAKVERPFRVIKRQFGYTKVRYREV